MKKKMSYPKIAGLALLSWATASLLLPGVGQARMGANQPCGNCHTMHNSQDGAAVAIDSSGNVTTTPNKALLIETGCVACHTGANTLTSGVPYVFDTSDALDLAGGNFDYVNTADANGHNVVGISNADATLTVAPGGTMTGQLTCASATGCHGDRSVATDQFASVSGAHHGKAANTYMDGSDLVNSYRMLNGVKGIEDLDWEKTNSATDHNQYYGVPRVAPGDSTTGSISALCATCHSDFHTTVTNATTMSNPWIRHPTDFDMNDTAAGSEYRSYGGAGVNAYDPAVPVASDDMTAGVLSAVFGLGAGTVGHDAIVTCVSCHRVHGSPNADMLRWDYSGMIAHGGTASAAGGCFACHTTKDDL